MKNEEGGTGPETREKSIGDVVLKKKMMLSVLQMHE